MNNLTSMRVQHFIRFSSFGELEIFIHFKNKKYDNSSDHQSHKRAALFVERGSFEEKRKEQGTTMA